MATAYVYSPITAWALVHDSTHNACNGGYRMVDIAKWDTVWHSARLYVSNNVKSVRFTRTDNCAPGCNSNLRNAVKVDLYGSTNASGYYFGWVLYGHLSFAIGNGTWNLAGSNYSNGVQLGYVVPYDPNCSTYYSGAHIHMETIRVMIM